MCIRGFCRLLHRYFGFLIRQNVRPFLRGTHCVGFACSFVCPVKILACFGVDVLVCVFVCKWSLVEASLSKMLHLIPIRQAVPPAHIPPVCLLECVSVRECVSAWPVAWYQICLSLSHTLEFSLITFSVAFLFFSRRVKNKHKAVNPNTLSQTADEPSQTAGN